ncbi:MAG: hypothetical protein ACKV2U_00480 [Bryobacteraceae bacterium]
MRVILDQSAPAPLRRHLPGHEISEAVERGWERLENGDLLTAAEAAGFEVLVTSDKNIRYQQNFTLRKIAVVVLGQGQWPALRPHVRFVLDAVNAAVPSSFTEVPIPYKPRVLRGS